jgi:hypothetical protein
MLRKETFSLFLQKIKKKDDVKSFIDSIEDNTLKETLTFIADEFLQNSWDELIERKIFNSACGGEKFFTDVNRFISEKNYEMLQISLLALKLGFKGARTDTSSTIKKIQDFLSIETKLKNYPRENFSQRSEKVVSLTECIVPFALIIILKQLFQFFSLKLIYWRVR